MGPVHGRAHTAKNGGTGNRVAVFINASIKKAFPGNIKDHREWLVSFSVARSENADRHPITPLILYLLLIWLNKLSGCERLYFQMKAHNAHEGTKAYQEIYPEFPVLQDQYCRGLRPSRRWMISFGPLCTRLPGLERRVFCRSGQ